MKERRRAVTTRAKTAAFFVAAMAAGSLFAETETVNGVTWTYHVKNGNAEIGDSVTHAAIPTSTSGEVVVPSKLGGHPVVCIGDSAFYKCNDITGVTIPAGVKTIGPKAFAFCNSLTKLSMPSSVRSIGSYAFYDNGLKSLEIPSGVESVSEYAFYSCDNLESVKMPDSVSSIGQSAFFYCRGLASVTIPVGVTNVAKFAFSGCTSLTSVKMPKIPFDETVFKGCPDGLSITYWETYLLTLKPSSTTYGRASGGGAYKPGTRVTIKAEAKTGGVFAGWFADKACANPLNPKGYDNRSPAVKVTMPERSMTVFAKFITVAEAKNSLKFSSATKKLAKTAAKATAGSAFSLALGISSASLPTVTAKGLPSGLSIDKTTGEISGKAKKPGSYVVAVTVTDAIGHKISQEVKVDVSAPSWARGTFYGLAYPGIKASDSWSYLKFTADSSGQVSGKVKYRGKWRSFKSAYSSCSASQAKFSPKIKIGSYTFKPGAIAVKTQKVDGLAVVAASDKGGFVTAQKKPKLVKGGKALSALVGKSYTFTKAVADSGLTKSRDRLVVALGNGDVATVSGVIGGKKLSPISWALLVADPGVGSWSTKPDYTLYVDIIDPSLKYERTLVLQVYVKPDGTLRGVTPLFM